MAHGHAEDEPDSESRIRRRWKSC